MKRIGFVFKVKQDLMEEYKEHHRHVWPEMQAALKRNGWNHYSLFMREDGLLFGYFEAPVDFQTALDGMAKEEVNTRWQDFMAPYFDGMPGVHPDKKMLELEEIMYLD